MTARDPSTAATVRAWWSRAVGLIASLAIRRGWLSARFCTVHEPCSRRFLRVWVRPDSMVEHSLLRRGMYGGWERSSLRLWAALARAAHTVVDIGANTGIFSLLAQAQNPAATVVAFEPVPENVEVLRRNLGANAFGVRVETLAVSDSDGVATMHVLKDRLNYMSAVGDNRYAAHPRIQGAAEVVAVEVATRRFDLWFEQSGLRGLSLLKIDVEGHESAVLRGMLPCIERYRPAILVEIIGAENAAWLQETFTRLEYRFVSIDEIHAPRQVDRLWDNDHHNFLLCDLATLERLRATGLVASRDSAGGAA